jgi:HSP20 family protein
MAKSERNIEKKEEKTLAPRTGGLVPFEEVDRWFDEINRRFDEFFSRRWLSPFERLLPGLPELRAPFEGRMPRVDMIDRDTDIVIRAELPGITKEDLDVSMTDDAVTLRASVRHEEKEEKGEYYRREMSRGEFQRTLRLPAAVKGEQAKATFKDGILELVLPKMEQAKRKTIRVE